jgi:hypothetical protein
MYGSVLKKFRYIWLFCGLGLWRSVFYGEVYFIGLWMGMGMGMWETFIALCYYFNHH